MWKIILQLHKGSSSSSSTSKWKPNAYQKSVLGSAGDENSVLGNLLGNEGYLNTSADLRNAATDQLNAYNNSALGNYDYSNDLANAQAQIAGAQAGYGNLANGIIPTEFQTNMENSIRSGVQNTMGTALDSLASRGVLNSSVTNTAMSDISKNAADTMAQQYSANIDTLGNIYNNQLNSSTASMSAAQQAQNAQYAPSLDMLNAGIGAYNTAASVLGLGGTTSSVQSNGGGGAMGAVAGLAGGVLGAFCFTDDTKIAMADGTEKRISNIHEGDEVVVYDTNKHEDVVEKVVEVAEPHYATTYALVCVDSKNKKKSVFTTLSQPLLTEEGIFIEVGNMRVGTKLKGIGKVIGIVESGERKVYDFKTDGSNTYYANGFIAYGAYDEELTHNAE